MTVVSTKGNVCELQPKESTLYTIWSTDPTDSKLDGVGIESGFSEFSDKAVMDKIFDSLDYKERGLVPPTWLRGAASYVISVTDEATLGTACRIAWVHVRPGRKAFLDLVVEKVGLVRSFADAFRDDIVESDRV